MSPDTSRLSLAFRAEAAAARLLLRVLRALGPVGASNLAGGAARALGPLLPVSRVADTNLRLALPELDAAARRRIVRGVWDNLGRTVGEFAHIATLRQNTPSGPGWDLAGEATMQQVAARGGPVIFMSGHFGNWELLPAVCAAYGIPLAGVFRAAANPAVEELLVGLRRAAVGQPTPMFSKGAAGAKAVLGHLRGGGYLGLLMDQKMNDGIEATLFGHKAMTASAMAALALRFGCPVIPGYVQRLGPARFRLVCEPPLALPGTGDRQADIANLTQTMNDTLERWIRERPEGWLWLHRRWPKEHYRR